MPQPKKSGTARKRTATTKKAAPRSTAKRRDDANEASLRDSLTGLRDTLARGIILSRERLAETLEDAVRRGRMTREDAEDLTASLVGLGRRQAQDLLADVENVLDSSRRRTSERTDAIVRQVDRARRAAGIGPTFPILGYDDLTAAQVAERLSDLSSAELRKVRDHERRNANRKSVLTALDRALK
ncbi:MAG: plectin [Solirubrobacteraceae bacterium]|nr:plectin [Solirubrobacteraceae bacterium]